MQIVWPHPPCPQCRLLYTSLHDRMGQRRILPSLGVQLRGAGKTSPQTTAGLLEVVGSAGGPGPALGEEAQGREGQPRRGSRGKAGWKLGAAGGIPSDLPQGSGRPQGAS